MLSGGHLCLKTFYAEGLTALPEASATRDLKVMAKLVLRLQADARNLP